MEKKYGSELWFQERSLSERISVKDALKFALSDPLQTFLVIRYFLSIDLQHLISSPVQNHYLYVLTMTSYYIM